MRFKNYSRCLFEIFLFFTKIGVDISCKLSPRGQFGFDRPFACTIKATFCEKMKKKINLSSAKFANMMVKVKINRVEKCNL